MFELGPAQIGGVARADQPYLISYRRHPVSPAQGRT
jgi:hypothetical protein